MTTDNPQMTQYSTDGKIVRKVNRIGAVYSPVIAGTMQHFAWEKYEVTGTAINFYVAHGEDGWRGYCPALDVAACGGTQDEAMENTVAEIDAFLAQVEEIYTQGNGRHLTQRNLADFREQRERQWDIPRMV